MKRVQGAESSTELFGRKRRGFAVFSLPGPGLPHSHSTVLYRTRQKTGWRSHYCYEGCRVQGRGWPTEHCCPNAASEHGLRWKPRGSAWWKLSPQMQKAVPWRQASRKWQRGSRAVPSWIQQQSFPIGLLVLFFKVKKQWLIPLLKRVKRLLLPICVAE